MADTRIDEQLVAVEAKLYQSKAYGWFQSIVETVRLAAIARHSRKLREEGVELNHKKPDDNELPYGKLDDETVKKLVDELDGIQARIRPLAKRREEIRKYLQIHWAHTGIRAVDGSRGKTNFVVSYTVGIAGKNLQAGVSTHWWRKISVRILRPDAVLHNLTMHPELRDAMEPSVRVYGVKVSIKTPQAAEAEDEDESSREAA
jgi:hypothetical protein